MPQNFLRPNSPRVVDFAYRCPFIMPSDGVVKGCGPDDSHITHSCVSRKYAFREAFPVLDASFSGFTHVSGARIFVDPDGTAHYAGTWQALGESVGVLTIRIISSTHPSGSTPTGGESIASHTFYSGPGAPGGIPGTYSLAATGTITGPFGGSSANAPYVWATLSVTDYTGGGAVYSEPDQFIYLGNTAYDRVVGTDCFENLNPVHYGVEFLSQDIPGGMTTTVHASGLIVGAWYEYVLAFVSNLSGRRENTIAFKADSTTYTSGPFAPPDPTTTEAWQVDSSLHIVRTACPGCPAITSQPANVSLPVGFSPTFSVEVSSDVGVTYRWQMSTDGGSSWQYLTETSHYVGVLTANLSVVTLVDSDNGHKFRCVVTAVDEAACSATSHQATITIAVDGGDGGGDPTPL